MLDFIFSPNLRRTFHREYQPQRIPGAALSALRGYQVTLNLFDNFLYRDARLPDLNNETVACFQAARLGQVSRATVSRDICCISSYQLPTCAQRAYVTT